MEFNVFDIETFREDNGRLVPYCICYIEGGQAGFFYGEGVVGSFLEWVIDKKIIIYAHNLTFDGAFIIEECSKRNISTNGLFYRNSIYEIRIKDVIFRCSYKIFPLPLSKIGELLGGKQKLNFDHNFIKKNMIYYIGIGPRKEIEWDAKKETIKYCNRDVTITKKFLEKIHDEISKKCINSMINSKSISSMALNIFKNYFNKINIETKLAIEDDKIIRPSYYGGRCEVFGNPEKGDNIYHFDFTGMYSEIMGGSFIYGKPEKIDNIEKSINKEGFYMVEVESQINDIPVLPYRSEDGKLLFPNGKWRGIYWWEELKLFEEMGGKVEKILFRISFDKKGVPFKEFIDEYSKLRKKGKFENIFWKLFVNSLSGRMGMDVSEEITKIITNKEEYKEIEKKEKIIKERIINNIIIVTIEKKNIAKNINSNVSIAAMITSKARIKLYRGYESVKKNNGRILYSDTDSIFASFKKNIDNEKHGEIFWDISKEDTKITKAIFAIPKGYAIKTKTKTSVKLKGYSKNTISFEEFEKSFIHGSSIIKKLINFKKKDIIPNIDELEKSSKLNTYDKRIFTNKKKTRTSPITIYYKK